MNVQKIIFTFLIAIGILLALSVKIMKVELKGEDKSANLILVFLLLISILTIVGVYVSYNIQPTTKKIVPKKGSRGTRGMRGNAGNDGKCGLKCNDNSCYRKVLDHISKVYNIYCEINGLQKLRPGHQIENKYIRKKVQQICKSQILSNLVNEYGNHKLNLHGINDVVGEKCDLNRNCGAYDYILQKWTEWILIILKYKNGKRFLDTENFTDNNFNAMITYEDIDTSVVSNNKWVFDLGDEDCYNNEKKGCLSFLKIIEQDTDPNVQKDIMKRFRNTEFYRFYSTDGVPNAFSETIMSLPQNEKIIKLKSPFEEIAEYDAWYWGTTDIAKPRIIYKCSDTDDYQKVERKSLKKDSPKIKIRFSNDYYNLWSSSEARQAKLYYSVNNYGSKLSYVPKLQKGSHKVNIYRPKDFYDSSEKDPEYQSYKPIGDIITINNGTNIKTSDVEMFPKYLKKINDRKSSNYLTNGPKNISVLVSGPDTRLPIDFELIYKSVRNVGFNAGNKGFAIWRPIPPEGYVALGDVIHRSPNGEKPNCNIIRCIPEECVTVRKSFNNPLNYSFKTPNNVRDFNGNSNIVPSSERGEVRDTDKITNSNCVITSYPDTYVPNLKGNENDRDRSGSLINRSELDKCLNKLNVFRGSKSGASGDIIYNINPDYLYDMKKYMIKDSGLTFVPKEKQSKNYSILKIYDN